MARAANELLIRHLEVNDSIFEFASAKEPRQDEWEVKGIE
jgi:hypothetical protein